MKINDVVGAKTEQGVIITGRILAVGGDVVQLQPIGTPLYLSAKAEDLIPLEHASLVNNAPASE